MSTPTDGRTITLLDGEHALRFTGSALRKLERALGGWDGFGSLPLDSIFTALWAGLLHEDPARDIDAVADLVDLQHLGELGAVVAEAIADAMPMGDKKQGKGKRKAAAGAG